MTNAELISKIKAKIERLREIGGIVPLDNREQKTGYESALIDIEIFIDSLESEKPMEGLEKEIKKYCRDYYNCNYPDQIQNGRCSPVMPHIVEAARHFAQWGAEHAKIESEKPVPNGIEEAAGEYEKKHTYQRYDGGGLTPEYNVTLAEAFISGYNLCKEQMMKEAVEGEVCIPNVWVEHKEGKELVVRAEISKELGFKFGDKVRVIVIPNNDEK